MAHGRRLVQVGFMRRYDPAYRALKEIVASGAIGAPLMMHAAHRNPSVPGHYTSDMAINDTAVHDVDVVRWLLDDEVVADVGPDPAPQQPRRRAARPDLRPVRDGERCDRRRRGLGQHRLRLRHPRRGRGRDRRGRAGREQPRGGQARGRVQRPRAGRLARAFPARLRRRVPGMARRGRRRAPPPAPAPGTATPRRPSATPRSRRCAPARGPEVRCATAPASTSPSETEPWPFLPHCRHRAPRTRSGCRPCAGASSAMAGSPSGSSPRSGDTHGRRSSRWAAATP